MENTEELTNRQATCYALFRFWSMNNGPEDGLKYVHDSFKVNGKDSIFKDSGLTPGMLLKDWKNHVLTGRLKAIANTRKSLE